MNKPTKRQFVLGFFLVVVLLAVLRHTIRAVGVSETPSAQETSSVPKVSSATLSAVAHKHRIASVADYRTAFPDSQAVQIVAAERWGVPPIANRAEAEERMQELVYVDASPYYHVDKLSSSIPYLVPRAALLLQDIGQAFYDSLYVKDVPLSQFIVTSILRTEDDVVRLQRHNTNATDRSCHLFGTTFDICYNRYQAVSREVRNDTLKWVLSEVLRDQRAQGRCYVKYEVKQGCFHITVR